MATHQYIGARYVPKFFENPDGTNNWIESVPYEPLTIVTYLGNSYTSKKVVPPNININDHEYWVLTSNYNAQIEAYRSDVEELSIKFDGLNDKFNGLNDKVDGLDDKKIIFIGDSYLNTSKWALKTSNLLGLTEGVNAFWYAVGGEGFTVGVDNNGFLNNLKHFENMANKNLITDIIVMGGINDCVKGVGNYEVQVGIQNFANYAKLNYPNAKIYVGFIGKSKETYNQETITFYEYLYKTSSIDNGLIYLSGMEYTTRLDGDLSSDDLHPNESGGTEIARWLANWINKGSVDPMWIQKNMTFSKPTNFQSLSFSAFLNINDGKFTITINNIDITIPDSALVDFDADHDVLIATQNNIFVKLPYTIYLVAGVWADSSSTVGGWHVENCALTFTGNEIRLRMFPMGAAGWGVEHVRNISIKTLTVFGNAFDLA